MDDLDAFQQKLRSSLESVLREPTVSVGAGDFQKFTGFIISPQFEGMDESRRQEIVWSRIRETFDESERDRIEFLYTDAPSELAW